LFYCLNAEKHARHNAITQISPNSLLDGQKTHERVPFTLVVEAILTNQRLLLALLIQTDLLDPRAMLPTIHFNSSRPSNDNPALSQERDKS
jgi:hypothetical protein